MSVYEEVKQVEVIMWDDADQDMQGVMEGELTRKIKMLSDLSGGLRTDSLKSIHCRDDLVESVMLYVKQQGIELGRIDLEKSAGLVIPVDTDIGLNQALFLTRQIASEVLLAPDEADSHGQHTLHHELVHVHDNEIKLEVFGGLKPYDESTLEGFFWYEADQIWSEYYAELRSIRSLGERSAARMQRSFAKDSEKVVAHTNEAVARYKLDADGERLFDEALLLTNGLFKPWSSAVGMRHGLERLGKEHSHEVVPPELQEAFQNMENTLQDLYEEYPDWSREKAKEMSSLAIEGLFNAMGIGFTIDHGRHSAKLI